MVAKAGPSRHAPEEIDAYLDSLPEVTHSALERVRGIIHELVPGCTERVSYRIPVFRLSKDLVGLSAQTNHCSLHSMSPTLMKAMAADLEARGVKVSGATIHFTPTSPLPNELIETIIQARIKEIQSD